MDNEAWQIELFFDGDCPLCVREAAMMARLDRRGRLRLTDLTQLSPQARDGIPSREVLMREIHARTRDGQWVTGVEAFRRVYAQLGFAWLVRLSRLALFDVVLRTGYAVFARNRLRLTGRCDAGVCAVAEPSSRNAA